MLSVASETLGPFLRVRRAARSLQTTTLTMPARLQHDLVALLREREAQELARVGGVQLAQLLHRRDLLAVERLEHAPRAAVVAVVERVGEDVDEHDRAAPARMWGANA